MAKGKTVKYVLMGLCAFLALGAGALSQAGPTLLDTVLRHVDETSRKTTGKALVFATRPSVSLVPLGVRFDGVRWGDEHSDILVSAKSGHASLRLGSLLSGTPEIGEIHLDEPVVRINQDGSPDQNALRPSAEETQARQSAPHPAKDAAAAQAKDSGTAATLPLQLVRLVLQNGQVILVRPGGDRVVLSRINLSVRNIGLGRTGEIESDCVVTRQQVSGSYLEANLAVQGKVHLDLPRIALQELQMTLTPVQGVYDRQLGPMHVTVQGSLDEQSKALTIDQCVLALGGAKVALTGAGKLSEAFAGDLALEAHPARLGLGCLQQVQHLALQSRVEVDEHNLKLASLQLDMDKARLAGEVRFALDPLSLSANLAATDINVDALLPKEPATGAARQAAGDAPVSVPQKDAVTPSEAAAAADPSTYPALDLVLSGERIVYRGVGLDRVRIVVQGDQGKYRVPTLQAQIDGQASLQATAEADLAGASCSSRGSLHNLTMATIEKLAAKRLGMSGTGNLDWDVSTAGRDGRTMAREARGSGKLVARSVHIAGVNKAIRETAHLAGIEAPEHIDSLSVPFTLGNGRCNWTARLSGKGLSGTGKGVVDCLARTIDAHADMTIRKVSIPLKIHGPLASISYAVDVEKLLQNMGHTLGKGLPGAPARPGEGLKKLLPAGGLKKLF